mgnify:CR=1 FL=1
MEHKKTQGLWMVTVREGKVCDQATQPNQQSKVKEVRTGQKRSNNGERRK